MWHLQTQRCTMQSILFAVFLCFGVLGTCLCRIPAPKPGKCPKFGGINNGQSCNIDQDCPGFLKCCCPAGSTRNVCTFPIFFPIPVPNPVPVNPVGPAIPAPKPGRCPKIGGISNGQSCTIDQDCPAFLKCCTPDGTITPACYVPIFFPFPFPVPVPNPGPIDPDFSPFPSIPSPVKPGRCPAPSNGPCVIECYLDSHCRGRKKCCFNGCGLQCKLPVKIY